MEVPGLRLEEFIRISLVEVINGVKKAQQETGGTEASPIGVVCLLEKEDVVDTHREHELKEMGSRTAILKLIRKTTFSTSIQNLEEKRSLGGNG